jgi:lysophospholipase L1-like esterase
MTPIIEDNAVVLFQGDGVHPSPTGPALIAGAWLRAVKAITE